MKLFQKEKIGRRRIITIFGMKFEYRAGKSYKAAEITTSGVTQEKREQKIIVSLTSFPARIEYVSKTICSLLDQTLKPDMVILWLGDDKFPNKEADLPEDLLKLKEYGLTIKWCKDIRSYTKFIPAYKEFPNDLIVTVDDDIYYDRNMLELLYNSYQQNPEYIHCHRCTKIFYKNGKLKAKAGGKKYYKYPSFANKLCGVGGVIYPPHCLYKDITDENLFKTLCPTNDDIWFWLMAVLQGTKVKVIKHNIPQPAEIDETIDGPCLTKINDHGQKLFYKDLESVLGHYQGLEEKIKSDMR